MGRFTWEAYLQATVILVICVTLYWFAWRTMVYTNYNISGLLPLLVGPVGLYFFGKIWMEE